MLGKAAVPMCRRNKCDLFPHQGITWRKVEESVEFKLCVFKRRTIHKRIWLSMHPRNFLYSQSHPHIRPYVSTSTHSCWWMWNGTLTSLYSKAYTICVWLGIGHSCYGQLTALRKRYPLISVTWLYIWGDVFLKLSADLVLVFNWSGAQVEFLRWNSLRFLPAAKFKLLKKDLS